MSNFERRFENWREKMNRKTEKEKHAYALGVAFIVTLIVFFFVASNWYFQIMGDSFNTSFFTDVEATFNDQRENFYNLENSFTSQKNDFMNTLNMSKVGTSTQ